MHVTRRRLLHLGSVGWTGLTLPKLLAADAAPPAAADRAARVRSCILIFLDGGPSHIDLFDRRPTAPSDIRGPFQSIATSVPGIQTCEHLPQVARQMHRILQVRSVTHADVVHDPAVYQMLTGYRHVSSAGGLRVEETDRPHWGAALAMVDSTRAALPRFMYAPERMAMEVVGRRGERHRLATGRVCKEWFLT